MLRLNMGDFRDRTIRKLSAGPGNNKNTIHSIPPIPIHYTSFYRCKLLMRSLKKVGLAGASDQSRLVLCRMVRFAGLGSC